MNNLIKKALDVAHWRKYQLLSDFPYNVENGRAFRGSKKFSVSENEPTYILFSPGDQVTARVYDRIIATTRALDVSVVADSDEPDIGETTDFYISKLDGRSDVESGVVIKYGQPGGSLSDEEVIEETFLPAQRGPQSAGIFQSELVYSILNGKLPPRLLKLQSRDSEATVSISYVWTEFVT